MGGATLEVRSESSDIQRRTPVDSNSISPRPRFPTKDRVKSSCILFCVSSSECVDTACFNPKVGGCEAIVLDLALAEFPDKGLTARTELVEDATLSVFTADHEDMFTSEFLKSLGQDQTVCRRKYADDLSSGPRWICEGA